MSSLAFCALVPNGGLCREAGNVDASHFKSTGSPGEMSKRRSRVLQGARDVLAIAKGEADAVSYRLCERQVEEPDLIAEGAGPLWEEHNKRMIELYRARDYTGAEEAAKLALELAQRTAASCHPDLAASLNNLADIHFAQARPGEAEPLYKQALEVWERALARNYPDTMDYRAANLHSDMAASLNNLAALYHEAGPLFLQAQEALQRAHGPKTISVAINLLNLAKHYRRTGQPSEAEKARAKARRIAKHHGLDLKSLEERYALGR